jgi:N-acetylglutamate synthase-like GNAT family acetyltransferase
MFHVEKMQPQDYRFAEELTDTVDWGFVQEDFEFINRLEPEGCLVLCDDSERIGIATTIAYGKVGWFGNLIVTEQCRRRGGGAILVKHALNYLSSRDVTNVGLYAYLNRIPFYESLGFARNADYSVLSAEELASSRLQQRIEVDEASKNELKDIIAFDSECFGYCREKLLAAIMSVPRNICYIGHGKNGIEGYVMAKVYKGFAEVGPLVCRGTKKNVELSLLEAVFCEIEGFTAALCVPKNENQILDYARKCGFMESFPVVRMFFNPLSDTDCTTIAESLERG